MQEYKRIQQDPPPGAAAAPANEGNMFLWQAVIVYVIVADIIEFMQRTT